VPLRAAGLDCNSPCFSDFRPPCGEKRVPTLFTQGDVFHSFFTEGLSMATTSSNNSRPKPPTHIVYQVQDREGKPGFWTRIGGAWPHADGQGFNLQLAVVPLDGRITLRVATANKKKH